MSNWLCKRIKPALIASVLTISILAGPVDRLRADNAVELLGVAELPGTAVDRSGLQNRLEDGSPHNRLGGLSAIEYTGANDLYYALPDRGPKDGTVRYHCRFQLMELKLPQSGQQHASARVVGTTLLSAADGKPYLGLAGAFDPKGRDGNHRFDPEGLRRGPTGNLFISDEYGPAIIEFDSYGHALRSLPVPVRYQIRHPSANKDEEIARNSVGRIANAGFEGLAISRDGKRIYALEQLPLLQDSRPAKSGKRHGLSCRLLEIDLASGGTREFVYRLENHHNKLSEILAVAEDTFLVIERDGETAQRAAFKRIMAINLANASDTSGIQSFPPKAIPEGVRPVKKSSFIDLLDPRFGLAGRQFPEKLEGLAWGTRSSRWAQRVIDLRR